MTDAGQDADLARLLERHREALVRHLERTAGGLLRYEDAEDLAQGVHLHALGVAEQFEYRGERAFVGWLFAVARRFVADRNAYWKALRRNAGPLMRVTYGGGDSFGSGIALASGGTGPGTFSVRRELLSRCARCLAALPERDQRIVEMIARDASIEEMSEILGLGYAATQRARLRVLDRFRRLMEMTGAS